MRRPMVLLGLLVWLWALLIAPQFETESPLAGLDGRQEEMNGVVRWAEVKEDGARLEVAEDRGSRVLLTVYSPQFGGDLTREEQARLEQSPGRRICVDCRWERPDPAVNPGCFDYRRYLKSRRISMTATSSLPAVSLGPVRRPLIHRISRMREGFCRALSPQMSSEGLAMMRAMLFGDKNALDEERYEEFQRNGTAHILAVSGLHVGMIYALVAGVLGGRRRVTTNGIIAAVLLLYGALSGWAPSVCRAIAMILLHILARLTHRRYDLLSSAMLVSGGMLLYEPAQLYNIGFQMSFLAILLLAMALPLWERLERRLPRRVEEFRWQHRALLTPVLLGILPGIIIQIGIMPYVAYTFNYVAPLGILANVPVVFLAGIIVPAGVVAMGLVGIFPGTGDMAGQFLNLAMELMIRCNEWIYDEGRWSRDVTSPPCLFLWIFYGGLFLLSSEMFRIWWSRRQRWRMALAVVMVLAVAVGLSRDETAGFRQAQAIFVNVGQGACIHLRTPAGRNILIDGGGRENYNVGKKILKPYLLKNGVGKVDLAVATHRDTDHYQGLVELEELGMADRIITNGSGYRAGDLIYREKDFSIRVLWPEEPDESERGDENGSDENEKGLVLRADWPKGSLLATGDIGQETEAKMVAYWSQKGGMSAKGGPVDVDVMAVPHHGSKYSSSDALVESADPLMAVIPVGKNNYGHPTDEAIATYEERGVTLKRTDENGAVAVFLPRGCRTMIP